MRLLEVMCMILSANAIIYKLDELAIGMLMIGVCFWVVEEAGWCRRKK